MVVIVVVRVGAGREAVLALDRRLQLLARRLAVGHRRALEQEVDDLVLVQRRAQLGGGHRLLLDVLDEPLAILGAVLLRGLHDQPLHLLVGDLDAVGLADLRQEQAQPHAALGDLAVIVALRLHLGARGLGVGLVRRLVLELRPDLAELGVDHRRRHREVVALCELVEQLALHVGARQPVVLLLDLAAQQLLQLIEALETQVLRELVVDRVLARGRHRLDDEVEGRRLPGELLGGIIVGEGDRDLLLVARLDAHDLVLEAGDQATRADLDRHVGARAALEGDAVGGLPDEVDDDLVALLGRLVARVVPALRAGGELLQLLVDLAVGDGDRQPLQRQPVDRGGRHVGQHLQLDLDLGVLAGRVILAQLDRRLHRGTQRLVGDQLLDAVADRGVERVGGQRLAVHLAHQVGRHLAGAEAGHPHRRRDALDLGVDLGVYVLGSDGERVGALEALVERLDSLHGPAFDLEKHRWRSASRRAETGAGEGTRTPTSCDGRT